MPSQPRQYHEGYWYHVYARGLDEVTLFTSRGERLWFIQKMDEIFARTRIGLGSLSLLDTHYHALVHMGPVDLGLVLQTFHMSYAKYVNRQRNRRNSVFEREPGADIVLDDSYLLQLVPYIHHNATEAGLVSSPQNYEWHTDSMFRTGRWVHGPLESWLFPPHFEDDDRHLRYRERMGEPVEFPRNEEGYIGSEEEWERLERRDEERKDRVPDRRNRRSLEEIAHEGVEEEKTTVDKIREPGRSQPEARIRQRVMAEMYEEGYGPTEIGEFFGRSPGSVLHAVKKFGSPG